MSVKIITCACGEKYPTRKDPKAELARDRPQCGKCGKREYKKISSESSPNSFLIKSWINVRWFMVGAFLSFSLHFLITSAILFLKSSCVISSRSREIRPILNKPNAII
jgi:hypothetical protein